MAAAALALLLLAAPSGAWAASGCRQIAFDGDVAAGASFVREIGGGLALWLQPQQFSDDGSGGPDLEGWRLMVVPIAAVGSASAEDHIFLVNPPLRFNPWQDLGTSYGVTAEEKLKEPIVYPFVLSGDDLRKMTKLVEAVLWPYTEPDPDRAIENYGTALADTALGVLHFESKDVETAGNGKSIRRLSFAVKVTVPDGFALSPALPSAAADCPSRENWP
jgi:hypothetical protein